MKIRASGPAATEQGIHEAVAARTRAITDRVTCACERSGRDPETVTIVAISKTFGLEHIRAAAAAGLEHFGENRVQEAQQKVPYAPDSLRWHMVGGLQRNKAKAAAGLFDVIQSVDSLRLARAIDRAVSEKLPVLVQANVTGNPRQHGLAPDEIINVVRSIDAETSLKLDGLMTIAPFVDDEATLRRSFAGLRDLLERVRDAVPDQPWTHLSMGMTNDFDLAVEEGATIVRIGRAIFGDRR